MRAWNFVLWPQSSLDALALTLEQTVAAWRTDWGIALQASVLSCLPADRDLMIHGAGVLTRLWQCADSSWWSSPSEGFGRSLHPLVDDPYAIDPSGASLGVRVAEESLQALLHACDVVLDSDGMHSAFTPVDAQQPPHHVYSEGSGFVIVRILIGRRSLALLVAPELVNRFRAIPIRALSPALTPMNLRDATLAGDCRLRVVLGEAEADIESIVTLGVGDVVRLEQRVDEPLRVEDADQMPLCLAAIGQKEGRMAAQLIKSLRTENAK